MSAMLVSNRQKSPPYGALPMDRMEKRKETGESPPNPSPASAPLISPADQNAVNG